MKTKWLAFIAIMLIVGLLAGVTGVGLWLFRGSIVRAIAGSTLGRHMGGLGWGPGMMGGYYRGQYDDRQGLFSCCGWNQAPGSTTSGTLTIEEAHEAVEEYVGRLGYEGMEVDELMEFSRNFYAIVAEESTGIGAMELLIDKENGAVGPEPGPNMMWNAKYGMHGGEGGMMGGAASPLMTVSDDEALDIAQRWLNEQRPGTVVESHADPFYGYYTIHTLLDGQISGMLSVHGSTGQVWYHSWHGDFVQMIGEEEPHA